MKTHDFQVEKNVTDENYRQLTVDCLKSFKGLLGMIMKLPIKKAEKIKGQVFVKTVDELIKFYECEVN